MLGGARGRPAARLNGVLTGQRNGLTGRTRRHFLSTVAWDLPCGNHRRSAWTKRLPLNQPIDAWRLVKRRERLVREHDDKPAPTPFCSATNTCPSVSRQRAWTCAVGIRHRFAGPQPGIQAALRVVNLDHASPHDAASASRYSRTMHAMAIVNYFVRHAQMQTPVAMTMKARAPISIE